MGVVESRHTFDFGRRNFMLYCFEVTFMHGSEKYTCSDNMCLYFGVRCKYRFQIFTCPLRMS